MESHKAGSTYRSCTVKGGVKTRSMPRVEDIEVTRGNSIPAYTPLNPQTESLIMPERSAESGSNTKDLPDMPMCLELQDIQAHPHMCDTSTPIVPEKSVTLCEVPNFDDEDDSSCSSTFLGTCLEDYSDCAYRGGNKAGQLSERFACSKYQNLFIGPDCEAQGAHSHHRKYLVLEKVT